MMSEALENIDLDLLGDGVPPQATDMERAVLGAALMEQESLYIILENLEADDFYNDTNRQIFTAIKNLFEDSRSIDENIIVQWMDERSDLSTTEVRGYVDSLHRYVGSLANTKDDCETIIEKRKRRDAIQELSKLRAMAGDPATDFDEMLGLMDDLVFNLINDKTKSNTQTAETYIGDALEHIHSVQGAPDGVTGIGTGLDIDKITAGWQDRDFVVIAARPSMGKTAFTLQCMKYAARNYGNAGLISLEMANIGLGTRLIYAEAGVNSQKGRTGRLSDQELQRVNEAAENLIDLGLILDDTTFVNPSKLRAKVRGMIHQYDIKVLAIDYVQLMNASADSREQEVAKVSRTCKAIAKEYGIPVLGLCQLNRSPENRSGWNKRPNLSDLRESGSIEQDADAVVSMFRPEYYDLTEYPDGESTQGVTELHVIKQRNGPTGMKRVLFNKEQMEFQNRSKRSMNKMLDKAKEQKSQSNNDYPF